MLSRGLSRLALVGSAIAFALMAVLSRLLSRDAGGFTAGQLSMIRFVVGVLISLAAFRIRPALYRPHNRFLLAMRGISGGIVVVLYFFALARIPAAEAGLIYNLYPVFATALSTVVFRERPTIHLLLGLLAATAGVGLMLGRGGMPSGVGVGEIAAFGSAIFAAISANMIRGMRGTDNAPTIFFWFCLMGIPVVAPFSLAPWPMAGLPWLIAVGMGLSAFAAQLLMTEAYGALAVSEAAVWLQLSPIALLFLASLLLGERISATAVAGVLLGVAGVAWATVLGQRRTAVSPPEEPPEA
ncbi:MAG TPA: DMT family transporter [Candidatus Deferrimicrobiaceae bacterium]